MVRRIFGPVAACCTIAAVALAAPATAASAGAAPSASDFAAMPALGGVFVSPDNRRAALLVPNESGHMSLAVVDFASGAPKGIASYSNANVTRVAWVNDKRLVYEAYEPGALIDRDHAGTFAVDADGMRQRDLINWLPDNERTGTRIRARTLNYGWSLWRPAGDGSDDVFVFRRNTTGTDYRWREVARLNTVSGELSRLGVEWPPDTDTWVFDREGRLRVVAATAKGKSRMYVKPEGDAPFELVDEQDALGAQALRPLYFEADGQLVVATRRGRDTTALYAYDLRTRKLVDEPLVAVADYDVGEGLVTDRGRLIGVQVVTERPRTVWLDARLRSIQNAIDAALPRGRTNRLLCGHCASAQRFVVWSGGDRQPGEYYLYDHGAGRLALFGAQRPALREAALGEQSFHRVAARDGLVMPVVVTHPPGKARDEPLPAVLLVHGGPWVRGATLGYASEAQFLATHGYRVIEPDFRGSTGLGFRHFAASFGQWGLAMQDDLADALAWAVREKLVDPARVCIVGGSYGGYAALMGPVHDPSLYRCAVSFAGVTDLQLMFSDRGTDIPEELRRYSLTTQIGDPVADAEKLRQTSPLYRVADIKVPVLLVQGGLDRRVTPLHADRFYDAARAAGVKIERVDYRYEGHGLTDGKDRADYLSRLQKFLAASLAPAR